MAKKALKALFFDIDDTIFSSTGFAATARQQAIQAMIKAGLKMDEKSLSNELDEIISEFGSNYDKHFDRLIQRLPSDVIDENAKLLIVASGMIAYHQCKFRGFAPYEDALEVIKRLHERKLCLGIITAGVDIKQAEKIVRLGLLPFVEPRHIFITEAVGISKTSTKIYMRACRAANVKPEECGYVGDNPVVDVDIPHRIGMKTFLSRRGGKYEKVQGEAKPDHIIHNFWDLLEIIEKEYEIVAHV